ncbi:MAG: DUF2202 domain-containing protein [Gammaproteobacteria bacterium]|nr:DUF2202 domain-containing protein [Gammaproteobacteria bacterium]
MFQDSEQEHSVIGFGGGYPPLCGLEYTDEQPLIDAYRSLINGSESHLRSYVGKIEAIIGDGNYEAQYLSQDEVDNILGL